MKKRPSLTPRQIFIYALILLAGTALILYFFVRRQDRAQFSALTHQLFVDEMCANTLTMHYTLAAPENFGIYHYTPLLPAYHADTEENRSAIRETLDLLSHIQPQNLSESDAYTYQLLVRMLENSLALNQFPYYAEPLSPNSGAQSQLPILLAEYTFRSKQDVEDYLAILDQTDTYFASLLTYEQEKAAAGLSQSVLSLRKVKEQCDTILSKKALQEHSHFLQTTFEERLNALLQQGLITDEEKEQYLSQNNRLLTTVLQPAYEKLADGLFLLEDTPGIAARPKGLASFPHGKEYYEYLLISQTGSYRSVEDIRKLLSDNLQEEYQAICTLIQEHPEVAVQMSGGAYANLPCSRVDEMLVDLQKRMQDSFPALPKDLSASTMSDALPETSGGAEAPSSAETTPGNFPKVTIKAVSPSLENYCAPAFYLTAPLDDTSNHVIYLNQKDSPHGLELYTTLAHEGYPGHLYQTVYSNRNCRNQNHSEARQLLWYGGYLEGWALYVEFYGFDYAFQMLTELNRPIDAECVQLELHNRKLLLCLYSTMDIMIHYDNASRTEIAEFLASFGIRNSSAVHAVYDYIADEPCNYLKYYLGYLEIEELKKEACDIWGKDYSDYAFHKFLLDAGPSDFVALKETLPH